MNSSAFISFTLFLVQICGLCLAGVVRENHDPLESKELSKDSPDRLEETWDWRVLEGRNSSSEEKSNEKPDSEETEEDKDELRPIRSPQVLAENSSDRIIDETVEEEPEDVREPDESLLWTHEAEENPWEEQEEHLNK